MRKLMFSHKFSDFAGYKETFLLFCINQTATISNIDSSVVNLIDPDEGQCN